MNGALLLIAFFIFVGTHSYQSFESLVVFLLVLRHLCIPCDQASDGLGIDNLHNNWEGKVLIFT